MKYAAGLPQSWARPFAVFVGVFMLAGCGSRSDPPRVTDPKSAAVLAGQAMSTGSKLESSSGGFSVVSTCLDVTDQWLAGCSESRVTKATRIPDNFNSQWTYWSVEVVTDSGTKRSSDTSCLGLISPYDDIPLQAYSADCRTLNGK